MQLFVYKVFILFGDVMTTISRLTPFNGLLMLDIFTSKSYAPFPFLPFPCSFGHSFPPYLTVKYSIFFLSIFISS